jgi:hypothetical protein
VIFVFVGLNDDFGKNPPGTPPEWNQVAVEKSYWIRDYPPFTPERVMLASNAAEKAGAPDVYMPPVGSSGRQQPSMVDGPPMRMPERTATARSGTAPWNAPVRPGDFSTQELLAPLKPRIFTVKTPQNFREALAAILEDLSKM